VKNQKQQQNVFEGEIYPTNECGDVVITKYVRAKEVWVRFLDTGFETKTQACTIKRGYVRDKTKPRISGVGYPSVGDISFYDSEVSQIAYSKWHGMLERCYKKSSPHYKFYGAKGVIVSGEWHNFQTFAKWFVPKYREGYHLDKDLFSKDSKIYSPETCCLLPAEINFLIAPRGKNSKYRRGVRKDGNKFYTRVYSKGKLVYSGSFDTEEGAANAYINEKKKIIKKVAEEYYGRNQIDERIYNDLCEFEPL